MSKRRAGATAAIKNLGGRPRTGLPHGAVVLNDFALWMKENDLEVEALARCLGLSASTIYGYRRGTRPPHRRVAKLIEQMSNGRVTMGSWD